MRIDLLLLGTLGTLAVCTTAVAQSAAARRPYNLSIPAEPLGDALNELAQQSELQVLFSSQLVAGLRGPEIKGSFSAAEALNRLLANTGLRFEFVNPHTVAINGTAAAKPATSGPDNTAPAAPNNPNKNLDKHLDQRGENKMPRRNLFARLLGLSAVCGSVLDAGNACADTAAESPQLEEIVVTAERHAVDLQKVPLSVTALAGVDIERTGKSTYESVLQNVPGADAGIVDSWTA